MTRTLAALAAMATLAFTADASAAIYTGSATDRSGDLAYSTGDDTPIPAVDFTSVSVKYSSLIGRVDLSFRFSQAPTPDQNLNAGVGLGTIQPNGRCSTPLFHSLGWHLFTEEDSPQGQTAIYADSQNFSGQVTGLIWNATGDIGWGDGTITSWPDSQSWNFGTINPALVGKQYNCARAAMFIGGQGDTGGGVGEDKLDADWFSISPEAVATPPVTPPSTTPPAKTTTSPVVIPKTATPTVVDELAQDGPRLTPKRAVKATKKTLTRYYGKRFRQRKLYRVACKLKNPDLWTWRCSVKWRFGRLTYKGRILLDRRGQLIRINVDGRPRGRG